MLLHCKKRSITINGKVFHVNAVRRRGEAEVRFHAFLTSALDGGERLISRPGRFTSPWRTPISNEQEARWAGRTVEVSSTYLHSNPGPVSPQPTRYTAYATQDSTALTIIIIIIITVVKFRFYKRQHDTSHVYLLPRCQIIIYLLIQETV
jgi:hypothetical protein